MQRLMKVCRPIIGPNNIHEESDDKRNITLKVIQVRA
jgi:hypothetical protein